MSLSRFTFTLATALLATTAIGSVAFAEGTAGVTSAVNPDALGTPPAAPQRTLAVGTTVYQNEHIVTKSGGQAQMLFEDGSAVTVGPDAELTLDTFVYDPAARKGKLGIKLASGALRFVGGQLSKDGSVTIETPSATIGIRGGIAVISPTQVTFLFGNSMTVTGKDGSKTEVTRAGFSVQTLAGKPVSGALKADPAELAAAVASFEGKAGANGGAATTPTDGSVQSGFKNANGNTPPSTTIIPTINNGSAANTVSPQLVNPIQGLPSASTLADFLTPRTDNVWHGYAAALGVPADCNYPIIFTNANGDPLDITISTHVKLNTIDGVFNISGYQGESTDTGVLIFGGEGRSLFTNNSQFLASNSSVFDSTANGSPLSSDPNLYLISGGFIKTKFVSASNVDFCADCQYVNWGVWGGTAIDAKDSSKTPLGSIFFGTYVVGQLTETKDLPREGIATYNGVAIGAFSDGDNSTQRIAAGRFSMAWGFAQHRGDITITNLDGLNYTGEASGTRNFVGTATALNVPNEGYRTMYLNGSFFGPQAIETGGNFTVSGSNSYNGAGIFAAHRGVIGAGSLPQPK